MVVVGRHLPGASCRATVEQIVWVNTAHWGSMQCVKQLQCKAVPFLHNGVMHCAVHCLDSAQWQVLTLGKNLCICPRGGLTATLSPHRPVRWCGVPSVRYHFVRSAALPTGLALLYRVRWRIVSISPDDGDHFPVGTLHPWFNLKTFHSVNPGWHRGTPSRLPGYVFYICVLT